VGICVRAGRPPPSQGGSLIQAGLKREGKGIRGVEILLVERQSLGGFSGAKRRATGEGGGPNSQGVLRRGSLYWGNQNTRADCFKSAHRIFTSDYARASVSAKRGAPEPSSRKQLVESCGHLRRARRPKGTAPLQPNLRIVTPKQVREKRWPAHGKKRKKGKRAGIGNAF